VIMAQTLYFEKRYGVNIANVNTTEDIDKIIESKTGKKITLSNRKDGFIDRVGNVFPIATFDINKRIDGILHRR
jgi:hypothetical protein